MAQLSNRYATAIFELAQERGALEEGLDQAVFLRDLLREDDVNMIITHPRIPGAEKKSFFDEAFKKHVNADLMGFLHLAVDKGREEYIVAILNDFIDMANAHLRKATAYVTAAFPLKQGQTAALAALLSRKLSKQVDISLKVDPKVIGGLYIQVDGYYMDRTIRTRLQEMKSIMAEEAGSV